MVSQWYANLKYYRHLSCFSWKSKIKPLREKAELVSLERYKLKFTVEFFRKLEIKKKNIYLNICIYVYSYMHIVVEHLFLLVMTNQISCQCHFEQIDSLPQQTADARVPYTQFVHTSELARLIWLHLFNECHLHECNFLLSHYSSRYKMKLQHFL